MRIEFWRQYALVVPGHRDLFGYELSIRELIGIIRQIRTQDWLSFLNRIQLVLGSHHIHNVDRQAEILTGVLSPYDQEAVQNFVRSCQERGVRSMLFQGREIAIEALKPELKLMNQSALTSLEEGLEETLTLHRLGMMPLLKCSFRTSNCIESLNSMTGDLTRKVKRWTHSPQRHRWVATALLDIEPRLRRVKGYKHLPMLRQALKADLNLDKDARQSA